MRRAVFSAYLQTLLTVMVLLIVVVILIMMLLILMARRVTVIVIAVSPNETSRKQYRDRAQQDRQFQH
jgi:hypothetical protein